MTKRNHNFGDNNYKKPKLDDDIDALWGDEIDESILDDCIKLATQVLDEEKFTCNTLTVRSRLPSYHVFKEPSAKIFSSTQLEHIGFTQPGTSKELPVLNKENVNKKLEKEIEDIRQKFQEKEGEVSILRSQLRDTKTNFNSEHNKVQNELKKKVSIMEKQIQSVKSELEFKNLEIANLKQNLFDITKRTKRPSYLDASICDNKNPVPTNSSCITGSTDVPQKLFTITDSIYPLAQFDTNLLSNFPKKEKFIFESKRLHSSRNAIPYLQNQKKNSKRMCLNQSETSIGIVPILQKLICFTELELDSTEHNCHINKVVIVAVKLLEDLYKLLEQIKSNLKTENILQADTTYLRTQLSKNVFDRSDDNEIGYNAGTILNFLAELLPYSKYLKNCITSTRHLDLFKGVYEDLYLRFGKNITGHHILDKVVNILKVAGEIRRADMPLFLHSSIKLFTNLCKSGNYNCISEIFCTFTKEIIFLRPHYQVIYEITALFKEASMNSTFVEFILNKSKNCSTTKRGVVYFNTDACRFYIFMLMFEKCLYFFKNIPVEVCLNMSCFIYNTFKTSYWVHHQDVKECECLPHLYKLILEILFRALVIYKEAKKKNEDRLNEWDYLIKNKIITKILALMTFHSYDLTEKYITVLSQYKEIEKHFEEDDSITDLEKLSILEELPEVPTNNFTKVNF